MYLLSELFIAMTVNAYSAAGFPHARFHLAPRSRVVDA